MSRDAFNYTWIEEGRVMAGSIPAYPSEVDALKSLGIRAVLSLPQRDVETYPHMQAIFSSRQMIRLRVPFPDGTHPDEPTLTLCMAFLDGVRKNQWPVYVHCRGGIGRTARVLVAYYVLKQGYSEEAARAILHKRKNWANIYADEQVEKGWIASLQQRRQA